MDDDLDRIRERMKREILDDAGSSRPAEPVEVSGSDLASFVGDHDVAVVDVWAPWCGPCKQLEPVVERLASELSGRVAFGKLHADENPEAVRRLGIEGIPTLLFFSDGELVDRVTGVVPAEALRERALRYTDQSSSDGE